MDAQFWIYIVIGVIYFLSRLLKKPEEAGGEVPEGQQSQRRRESTGEETAGRPRQMTFEELLREITEGKQAQKPVQEPVSEPRQERQFERYGRDSGDEARSLERVDFDEAEDARILEKYEEAQSLANQRKSLEETLRLEDTIVDFKRFDAFEKKKSRNVLQDYVKIIRNPESLKHAVVMSEILQRKF